MKIEIDYSESDRFTKTILNKKMSCEHGIFKGNLKDFLGMMKELEEELRL